MLFRSSITVAGFNFGAVIGPPVIQWLISEYDWRRAFLVIGLVPLLVDIPLAFFTRKGPGQMGIEPFEGMEATKPHQLRTDFPDQNLSFSRIIKTGRFWIFGALQFSFGFCMQIIIIHIVPHADDIGIPAIIAAGILSVNAGFRIIGNLTIGFVSEVLGSRRVLTGSLIFLTSSLVWLIFASDIPGFILFAVIFGVMSGAVIPLLTLVPAELFGLNNLGIISGAFLLAGTLGGSIGSPLAGFIYDVSKSYEIAFITGASIGLAAIILSVALLRLKPRETPTSAV